MRNRGLAARCDALSVKLDEVLNPDAKPKPDLILVKRGLLHALSDGSKSFAELGDCLDLDTEPLAKLIESMLNKGLIAAEMKSFLAFFQLTERGREMVKSI